MRLVGEHDIAFHARQLVGDLFQDRHEGDVGHHHAILRVVDDPGDLVREQPRIDGMADRADSHDAVPGLEMAPGVPGDGSDAVAELDAVAVEPLRDFQCAIADFPVVGAMDRAFDRPRHDLLRAMNERGMLDNPVTQQRPILHQTKHTKFPPRALLLAHGRSKWKRFGCRHGIDMNFTAENASRKWAYGAFGRRQAAMVTVTALLLVLCTQAGPAQAARRPLPGIWGDLFGNPPPRLRRKVRAASVPLPRPRPAEAPV